MAVIAEKLTYVYNRKSPFETRALSNVDLRIEDGEFFAVIGHTGSGKSTFVQHLNALIRLQSGKLQVAGYDLTDKSTKLKRLRGDVGMVFQYPEYQLFADTVEKDVMFGLKNFNERKKPKKGETPDDTPLLTDGEMKDLVRQAIEKVGLDYDEIKDKSPFDLSGGQKRRVAIAGVIVTNPKILVLDEPSAGLDPQGKREIIQLVHSLKRQTTPTIIMISHDMDEVAANADRIAVFSEGRLEFVLPPKELFLHREELIELGLDIPTTVKIATELNRMGFDIAPNIVDYDELADAIAEVIR